MTINLDSARTVVFTVLPPEPRAMDRKAHDGEVDLPAVKASYQILASSIRMFDRGCGLVLAGEELHWKW
jgi:hypothetical protein